MLSKAECQWPFNITLLCKRSLRAYFARRRHSENKTVALKISNNAASCLRSVIPIRKGQGMQWNKDGDTLKRFSCVFCPEIRAFKNFILIQEKYSKDTGQVEAASPGYLLSFFFLSHKEFQLIYGRGVWRFVTCNFWCEFCHYGSGSLIY